MSERDHRDEPAEPPFAVGMRVRVIATGAPGVVVEVLRRFSAVDVDLGDGITAEFEYDELSVAGDWAAGRFTYSFSVTPKSGGPATTEFGKGMAWLRRTSAGSWQFTHMIWNLDQAAE